MADGKRDARPFNTLVPESLLRSELKKAESFAG